MRCPSAIPWGIALGVCLSAGTVSSEAQAQNAVRKSQPKLIVYQPQQTTEALIGVMGQVPRPGTYQFAGAPSLQLAVDAAGGLTESALPMVRIVRGQRVVQRVALQAAAKEVLQTGDLVIADVQPQRNGLAALPANDGIQVAFLGVTDRPVIVKVHASQARADLIVQMLGQSPDVLRTLRVIPPPNQEFVPKPNGSPPAAPLMSEGAVLLFERRQIVANELKDLPEIIPCALPEPDIGGYGVRNAYEERQSRDGASSRRPGSPSPWKANTEAGPLSQVPPPLGEDVSSPSPTLLPDHRIPATLSSSSPNGISAAPVTTLPFSGTAAISSRASRSTEVGQPSQTGPAAADTQDPAWNRVSDAGTKLETDSMAGDLDAEFDDEATAEAGAISIWHMLGVISAAGLLVGAALAIRSFAGSQAGANRSRNFSSAANPSNGRRAEPPKATVPMPHLSIQAFAGNEMPMKSAPMPAGERFEVRQQRFSQLINGELSVIEEPIALHPGLQWSLSATGEVIRQTPAPPIPAAGAMGEVSSTAASIRQIDPPHLHRVPEPHQRAAHEAPVERALRHLQGGRS